MTASCGLSPPTSTSSSPAWPKAIRERRWKNHHLQNRQGLTFASGNPLTAADAAFSLQRVMKLDKTPAFLITQLGWTKENVDQTGDSA